MRILDLFCGAGGAAMGLHRAFPDAEIIGIDIKPQPHYPFQFHQGDALTIGLDHTDFIWASPPCQRFSRMQKVRGREHPDFITPIRERLQARALPYVIENVIGAPLLNPLTLCGAMFSMRMYRHRLFECSFSAQAPVHPAHTHRTERAGRPAQNGDFISVAGHFPGVDEVRAVMDVPWMSRDEIAQAIPPAYSEYIARQLDH